MKPYNARLTSITLTLLFVATPFLIAAGQADETLDPSRYVRKATWQETLVASWQVERAWLLEDERYRTTRRSTNSKLVWPFYERQLWTDFPSPEADRQMRMERVDNVWNDFLSFRNQNGLGALAASYASSCLEADQSTAMELAKEAETFEQVVQVRALYYKGKLPSALELAKKTLDFVTGQIDLKAEAAALDALEKKIEQADANTDWLAVFKDLSTLRRRMILAHPALDFETLLVDKHEPPKYSHNCDQYLARHARLGKGLCLLTNWKSDHPDCASLLGDKLPPGDVLHPRLSYDGKKVIFSYCCKSTDAADQAKYPGGFFIFEAATDGSWVRRLTGGENDKRETVGGRATAAIEDFDPCYLPDGGFVFTSTRCQAFGRCHGGRYTPCYTIYRADMGGSNIRPIVYGEANEHYPTVLHDGRIVFTRWEYNNRNQIALHKLWAIRPDGTGISNFYGVNSATPWRHMYHDSGDHDHWYADVPEEVKAKVLPFMFSQTQPVPGSRKVVTTATSHHIYTTGQIMVIDPDKGEDGFEPLQCITPEIPVPEAEGWETTGAYMTPMPVTEDLFFASFTSTSYEKQHRPVTPWGYAILLIDTLGGRELIYRDAETSTCAPIPLVARQTPAVLPSVLPAVVDEGDEEPTGTLVVQNVYLTRNDPEGIIKQGDIQSLRVVEMIPLERNGSHSCGERNDFARRILGTAKVEEDGSAMFEVPATKAIYLQACDKHGMALLTLRSLFHLMPGEQRSCVGCHEKPGTPPPAQFQAAMGQPQKLSPPVGPKYEGGFSFARTVQPVFDRYCLDCHGLEKTEGRVNLMSPRGKPTGVKYLRPAPNGGWAYIHDTSDSWSSIVTHPDLVKVAIRKSNFGPTSESVNSRPKELFGHAGKLLPMLLAGHEKIKLDPESLQRVADWADMNYIRYGEYGNGKEEWHVPSKESEAALREYVEELFGEKLATQPIQTLVNVAQPDESRILMAPLPVQASGWGQIDGGYTSTDTPRYQKMYELVLACAGMESE